MTSSILTILHNFLDFLDNFSELKVVAKKGVSQFGDFEADSADE